VAVTLFVIGGYLVLQRSFAYLGIPAVNLFVGEVLLVVFLLFRPQVSVRRFVETLLHPSQLGAVAWAMFLLLLYGLILAVRGYVAGYPRLLVFQELVFNIYPLYILLGLWLGERDPRLLERFMVGVAWVVGIYGMLYVTVLNDSATAIPGTGLLLFRAPIGQSAVLLALVAFRPKGARMWVPFALNLLVLLGIQNRAAYAGLAAGMIVWAVMSKRVGRMLLMTSVVVALLAVAWVLDLRIELAKGASEYSARNVAAAVIAPFDEDTAASLSPDARSFAGTVEWRRAWWTGIWDGTHADVVRTAIGTGYGFELSSDAVLRSSSPDLRTPHNWFMYALGYGGWIGVLLFVFLLLSLGLLLWRADRITGVSFGLPFLVLSTTVATFSNFYETPFAAIPVWVIAGMSIAPALRNAGLGRAAPHRGSTSHRLRAASGRSRGEGSWTTP
jgi:hypothetical protein